MEGGGGRRQWALPLLRCPKRGVHRLTATRPCTNVAPFPSALGAGALIIISPIFVGILFGVNSVCGLIAGSIVSSVQVCFCAVWGEWASLPHTNTKHIMHCLTPWVQ